MNLLDPTITHYVMHEKTWKFGGGEILDTDGNVIGRMKRKIMSLRSEIQLQNADETPICIISKKLAAVRPIYDVKTLDEQLISRAKKPMISFRGSVDLYDPEDNLIMKAQGGVTKWNFEIRHPQDKKKVYAVIKKGDKWRDVFAPMFNFKDRYVIHVVDPAIDRLTLLTYAIIIDNVYHD